jgi:hypothetical protein
MDIKQYQKDYYKNNKEKLAKQKSLWYFKNKEKQLKRNKEYVKKNKDKINQKRKLYPSYKKRYGIRKYDLNRKQYPRKHIYKPLSDIEKYKQSARRKVRHAINTGKLKVLLCIKCGNKAEAHHADYEKPLDVIWLCPLHHRELHRQQKQL